MTRITFQPTDNTERLVQQLIEVKPTLSQSDAVNQLIADNQIIKPALPPEKCILQKILNAPTCPDACYIVMLRETKNIFNLSALAYECEQCGYKCGKGIKP